MATSLRERVRQLLLENDKPTPATYFGSGKKQPKQNKNPWIEAVKKYGSVAEAKKHYRKKEASLDYSGGYCCPECGRAY